MEGKSGTVFIAIAIIHLKWLYDEILWAFLWFLSSRLQDYYGLLTIW
jgi:hypothetical protein